MIDRRTIEQIKDRADIVDVVSEFVTLKKAGVNYRGLCPFHDDHSPSFYVSPVRRTCHCFVCGEGGDATGFIMKHEGLNYPEALRWLANRYGIHIEETELTEKQKQEQSERESMFIINEWASKYYNGILNNDIDGRAIGMQYFRMRGIRDDIIAKFRLGYSLADRHALVAEAKKQGYNPEILAKTGLCYKNDRGEFIDRFAGRVIFPWFGVSGKVTAFGGRVLDKRTKGVSQKYVNSPESEIYHKDHELFGIFQAKKAVAKENCIYMVEGYTDVISMHQCGIENVVANSGTALSKHQIHIIHRFTSNITLLYDGDAAGIKAALRGTDMLLEEGMNVKVLLLPDGDDPDSFASKHSAEEFRQHIKDNQTDFIEFKTKVLLQDANGPRERAEAVASIIKSISVISDPIVRAAYIQECSMRLGYSEEVLTAKMNEEIRSYRKEKIKEKQRRDNSDRPRQDFTTHTSIPQSTDSNNGSYPDMPDDFPPPIIEEDHLTPLDAPSALTSTTVATPSATVGNSTTAMPSSPKNTKMKKKASVEDLIIKEIIRYGGMILFDNVETEDGDTISLTLSQFVAYGLQNDGYEFENPLYNRILKEAAEQSVNGEFDSEKYFINHSDYDISFFAANACPVELLQEDNDDREKVVKTRKDIIDHLLADFWNERITKEIEQLTAQINSSSDPENSIRLMKELGELQKKRTLIAKQIGKSLALRK